MLTAQSSGRHSTELMFGGNLQQVLPQPNVTCVEFRAVDCSHHWVQLPACGQGELVRIGHSAWCSEEQQPHPQAGGGHGGLRSCTGQEQLLSHLPAGVEGIHCQSFPAARQCQCLEVPCPLQPLLHGH